MMNVQLSMSSSVECESELSRCVRCRFVAEPNLHAPSRRSLCRRPRQDFELSLFVSNCRAVGLSLTLLVTLEASAETCALNFELLDLTILTEERAACLHIICSKTRIQALRPRLSWRRFQVIDSPRNCPKCGITVTDPRCCAGQVIWRSSAAQSAEC